MEKNSIKKKEKEILIKKQVSYITLYNILDRDICEIIVNNII